MHGATKLSDCGFGVQCGFEVPGESFIHLDSKIYDLSDKSEIRVYVRKKDC